MATAYKTNWVVKTWIVSNNDGKCPRHPHIFNEEMAKPKLNTSSIPLRTDHILWHRHFGVCVLPISIEKKQTSLTF
jgi:hypothetical protein